MLSRSSGCEGGRGEGHSLPRWQWRRKLTWALLMFMVCLALRGGCGLMIGRRGHQDGAMANEYCSKEGTACVRRSEDSRLL